MDIKSPAVLKLKAGLFLVIALWSAGLLAILVFPVLSWAVVGLFLLSVWACCRAYYFAFHVLRHYADPTFRYAGLLDLGLYLCGVKKKGEADLDPAPDAGDEAGKPERLS